MSGPRYKKRGKGYIGVGMDVSSTKPNPNYKPKFGIFPGMPVSS